MPVFEYRGVNRAGKNVKGVLDADSPKGLKESLKSQGIYLSEYRETSEASRSDASGARTDKPGPKTVSRRGRRIKVMEIAEVIRQVDTLRRGAIPIVDCFAAVAQQAENPRLRRILNEVRRSVSEGKGLAPAMAEHPAVFSDLYINMVKAGESSGTLDLVFQRLPEFTEQQAKLRSKIISAMTYPIIMMCLGLAIVSLMMIFVVPKLTAMFTDMGQKLPLITRMLIGFSEFFGNWLHVSAAAIVLGIWLFNRFRRCAAGTKRLAPISPKVPRF